MRISASLEVWKTAVKESVLVEDEVGAMNFRLLHVRLAFLYQCV